MPEERTVKKVFKNITKGKGSTGKPKRGGWVRLKII
jgi:hypothetical protein